jgi:hypothetical protein
MKSDSTPSHLYFFPLHFDDGSPLTAWNKEDEMASKTPSREKPKPSWLEGPSVKELKALRSGKALNVKPLTNKQLAKLEPTLAAAPAPTSVLSLTPRKPFGQNGLIDIYKPGRWDCSSDLVFLDPIVVHSPGVWEGSVVYGSFKAPTKKTYLLAVHFYGWDITLNLSGGFGNITAQSQSNAPAVATGQQLLNAGQTTSFSFHVTGIYLGFLSKIEVLRL